MTEVAVGSKNVHERLKWKVLMQIGFQRCLTRPLEELLKRRVAREAHPQHERVDEDPDQALDSFLVRFAMGEPISISSWPV